VRPCNLTKALGSPTPSRLPLPAATTIAEHRITHGHIRETRSERDDITGPPNEKGAGCVNIQPLVVKISLRPVRLVREDRFELFHDFFFRMSLGDGEFLDQQAARGIKHLALAEGQLLVAFEHQQVAQDFRDFER
jgi:hypothetical protein